MGGEMRATDWISTLTPHVASKFQFQLPVHMQNTCVYYVQLTASQP